eukprot:1143426-Pelagomonas_calceolata.AAC.5
MAHHCHSRNEAAPFMWQCSTQVTCARSWQPLVYSMAAQLITSTHATQQRHLCNKKQNTHLQKRIT